VHTDNLSGDSISRVEREIAVFNRIRSTIPLSPEETSILESRLAGLEVDLEVERGKSKLLGQDFEAALRSFAKANETRPSLKLRVTCFGLKLWPRLILLVYRKTRSETLGLIRTENAVPGWTVFSVISALLRLFSE
jgi:hypothetical protein